MIISRLVLKNWRNFREVDVNLDDRVFIVGPNASGKSNLLDSIRFLRSIAKPGGGLQKAIAERGGLSKIRCLTARREPDVEISVDISDRSGGVSWRYAIGMTQQVRGFRMPKLRYEKVWRNEKLLLDRPDNSDKSDDLRLTQTHLEQVIANEGFRDVARFFETVRYLHLIPQLISRPEVFQANVLEEDPYGKHFLDVVAKTPEKTRRSRLKRIEAALREAVPQLSELTDVKDESGVPHLEAVYRHWRPNAGRQREDQFSDGTLRLIGLFWSLLDGDAPLLLEEPELSLHSAIVSRLAGLLYRVQRRHSRQVFVSTHSWELLSDKGINGDEILMLIPGVEGTRVELASTNRDVKALLNSGLSAADAALPQTVPAGLKQMDLFA